MVLPSTILLFLNLVLIASSLPLVERDDNGARTKRDVQAASAQIISSLHIPLCSNSHKTVPRSCFDAKQLGHAISGVYEIDPRDGLGSFKVYCDMETDGGGWTVFQRRKDGSEDFYRNWSEYEEGFGELYGEFWLGLNKLHRLAVGVHLRVDLLAPDNSKAYAKYEDFTVGNAKSMYVMYLGRYTGTAGDSMIHHKGMKFSTKDKDNDLASINCATSLSGAWWYNSCHTSNLNGLYSYGKSSDRYVVWHGFKSTTSLQKVEMKLK